MKKLLLILLAISLIITDPCAVFAGAAEALDSTETVVADAKTADGISLYTEIDGCRINLCKVKGSYYLFLPVTADITKLSMYFESDICDTDKIRLWGQLGIFDMAGSESAVDITSFAKKDGNGRYAVTAISESDAELSFYIMQGSDIPTIYLTSSDTEKDREWIDADKKHKAAGMMKCVDEDGNLLYDGALTEIKARGNSTFRSFDKKPYQIKLEEKTDLLNTGEKNKTWVLLANYADATMMHDKVFKDFAAELGMMYVADSTWVNLYYDGDYRGVYTIGEKNSIGKNGVDIENMEEAYEALNPCYGDGMKVLEATNKYGQKYQYTAGIKEPEDITGGYLIERNADYIDEASGFLTSRGAGFNVKSPEYAGQDAMTYISEYYQEFEDAVYAQDKDGNFTGYNEKTGKYYYEYVDKTSLIQAVLLQDFASNPDGFIGSFYLYKDAGKIMYVGPIWDHDLTLGTGWTKYITPTVKDYHYLAEALVKIPDFRNDLEEYFTVVFLPEVQKLTEENGVFDYQAKVLKDSARMNYAMWPYIRIGGPNETGHIWRGANYETVTEDMTVWSEERLLDLRRIYEKENITRSMFTAYLARYANDSLPYTSGAGWSDSSAKWAEELGLTDGKNLEKPITREQLATMLYRYEGKPDLKADLSSFSDGSRVSIWARDAMSWAVYEGLYCGYGNNMLKPQGNVSYDEMKTIVERYSDI